MYHLWAYSDMPHSHKKKIQCVSKIFKNGMVEVDSFHLNPDFLGALIQGPCTVRYFLSLKCNVPEHTTISFLTASNWSNFLY